MADIEPQSFATKSMALSNGLSGELVSINSANPATFYSAISDTRNVPSQGIAGQLFLPLPESPPVVIVVPGSLGIAASHVRHGERLTSAGIGVLLIDPFGPRSVTSTVANQAQYSFAASTWDVLAAASTLADDPRIDSARIGAQGHSRGGSAVINAAVDLFPGRTRLAAVYAAYPWCGMQFRQPNTGATVVRAIIGDQDEWCLPQQVQAYINAMQLAGGDASCRIVAGAQHSFDRGTDIELVADASVAPSAPTIYLEKDGRYVHPVDGTCAIETQERDLMLYGINAGYGVRGAKIGSSGDQADVFEKDMLGFWRSVFGV